VGEEASFDLYSCALALLLSVFYFLPACCARPVGNVALFVGRRDCGGMKKREVTCFGVGVVLLD